MDSFDEALDLMQQYAQRIRSLRLARGWTREVLAEESDVNVFTLKRFERTGQISLERFLKLCQTLDRLDEMTGLLKPRARVDIENWSVQDEPQRQRGKRRRVTEDAQLAEV